MTKKGFTVKRLLLSLLSAPAAAVGVIVTPVLMALPAFLAAITLCWGTACAAAAYSAAVLAVLLLGGDILSALMVISIFVPAGIILTVALKRRLPHRYSVSTVSAAIAIGFYVVLCVPSMLNGGGPFDELTAVFDAVAHEMINLLGMYRSGDELILLKDYMLGLSDMAPQTMTLVMVGFGMLFGFLDHIIAWALCVKAGVDVLPMSPFRLWKLGRSFTYGAMLLLIGGMVATYLDIVNSAAISAALQTIVLGPFALVGLSAYEYAMSMRPKGGEGFKVVSYILIVLLLPYSVYGLALFGVIDRMLNIRGRHTGRTGQ